MTFEAINRSLTTLEQKLSMLGEINERVLLLEQRQNTPPQDPETRRSGSLAARRAELLKDGGQVMLRKADDFHAYYGDRSERDHVGLADFLRGVAGMKTGELATKALSSGTDAAGGYAVPRSTMGEILGAMVPISSLMQAGASVIPVSDAKSFTTAVVNTLPTAGWRAEGGPIAESDPTFRAVVAEPKSLSFQFKVTRELLADAANMERALEVVISQAMAKELDRVGLRGSGTGAEPRGLLNTSGVIVQGSGVNGSAGPGYDTIVAQFDDILQTNAPMPTAAIVSPRSWTRFALSYDSTGQPLMRPEVVRPMQLLATTAIPNNLTVGTSNDCSEMYIGDFTNMAFLMREGISIQRLNERYAETGHIGFVCHARVDVAVWYPTAFSVVTGLR